MAGLHAKRLLNCPYCGQTYNPRYMMYCARCGEVLPDEHGRRRRPDPYEGRGSRAAALRGRAVGVPTRRPPPEGVRVAAAEPWRPSQAVTDMVLEYRNRLNEKPDDHDTRYSLALAYLYARQWEQAEAELTVVTEALPNFAEAWAHLARCRARLGKRSEALEAIDIALNLEPDEAQYHQLRETLAPRSTPPAPQ